MATRKEVLEFVENKLLSITHERKNFSEVDSFDKFELIFECEKEYDIDINEYAIPADYDTEMFVDFIMEIIE